MRALLRPLLYVLALVLATSLVPTAVLAKFRGPTAVPVAPCPTFGPVKVAGNVRIAGINEISGAVASHRSRVLWVHEDSGNPARVYAVRPDGRTRASIAVSNAKNRDWEDIALADGTLWVGDIGGKRNGVRAYWLPEPALFRTSVTARRLELRYAGGAQHNAEAMFVDARTDRLFIVTKERSSWTGFVYRADVSGLHDGDARMLRKIGRVSIGNVTAADIGPRGFIVRNLSGMGRLYRWRADRKVATALRASPCEIIVGRGESIAFSTWNERLYTVPEGTNPQVRYVSVA